MCIVLKTQPPQPRVKFVMASLFSSEFHIHLSGIRVQIPMLVIILWSYGIYIATRQLTLTWIMDLKAYSKNFDFKAYL